MALFVVRDVLDTLPCRVFFPQVGFYLLFVLCFYSLDVSLQVHSSISLDLSALFSFCYIFYAEESMGVNVRMFKELPHGLLKKILQG